MVVSSALGVCFIFLIMILAARHFLLPGIIIIGSFILFVLWLTGLIETSLQLYGVVGNVNDNCQIYVTNNKAWGNNINTLAWLTQSTICEFSSMPSFVCFVYWLYRQLLENCLCARACEHDFLSLDDDYVVAGESGCLWLISLVFVFVVIPPFCICGVEWKRHSIGSFWCA